MKIDSWQGCYDEGWKGMIVDDAFAHPAKMSYSLVARIYEHAFQNRWLKPGDKVIDQFGGICGGALHAAIQGVQWVGCELEPKFHELGNQNIELWQRMYGHYPEWVRPVLHCGDSRRLCEVLGVADLCVSSPPFAVQQTGGGIAAKNGVNGNVKTGANCGYQNQAVSEGNLAALAEGDIDAVLSSPPYATGTVHGGNGIDQSKLTGNKAGKNSQAKAGGYGSSDGQLSDMIVGSPPYADGCTHTGGADPKPEHVEGGKRGVGWTSYGDAAAIVSSPPFCDGGMGDARPFGGIAEKKSHWNETTGTGGLTDYGKTTGQLGAMIVGSPPFEQSNLTTDTKFIAQIERDKRNGSRLQGGGLGTYGDTAGNIGNDTGETFWSASRLIVQQCHTILRPGGVAIWVCKDFVRKGKRVPFSDQWLALCEAMGFDLVCRHRASLVKTGGTQRLLDGGTHTTTKERKSFFRRLAEKKGSPRIDWEDVICVQKPHST